MTSQQKFYIMDAFINNAIATAKALGIDEQLSFTVFLAYVKGLRSSYYNDYNTDTQANNE